MALTLPRSSDGKTDGGMPPPGPADAGTSDESASPVAGVLTPADDAAAPSFEGAPTRQAAPPMPARPDAPSPGIRLKDPRAYPGMIGAPNDRWLRQLVRREGTWVTARNFRSAYLTVPDPREPGTFVPIVRDNGERVAVDFLEASNNPDNDYPPPGAANGGSDRWNASSSFNGPGDQNLSRAGESGDDALSGGAGSDILVGGGGDPLAGGDKEDDTRQKDDVAPEQDEFGEKEPAGGINANNLRRMTLDERMKALGLDWREAPQPSPNLVEPRLNPAARRAKERLRSTYAHVAYHLIRPLILPGHILQGGAWTPDDTTDLALAMTGFGRGIGRAPTGALTMSASRRAALDMSEGARMARAAKAGYSSEPFYRGQTAPTERGGITYYSRDPETARGFGDLKEYRLAIEKPLHFGQMVTLKDYVDVINALAKQNENAAAKMAAGVPFEGEWTVDRLSKAAERQGDIEIMNGAALFQTIETVAGDAVAPLRAAGYDAIDTGRDVRMLKATGQRLKDAAFDPDKIDATDLRASLESNVTHKG